MIKIKQTDLERIASRLAESVAKLTDEEIIKRASALIESKHIKPKKRFVNTAFGTSSNAGTTGNSVRRTPKLTGGKPPRRTHEDYNNRAGGFPYRSAPCSALPSMRALPFGCRLRQGLPQVLEQSVKPNNAISVKERSDG